MALVAAGLAGLLAPQLGSRPGTASARERAPLIAVVDTGADLRHPAYAGLLWSNPGEVANGLDDDGDGLVDDLHGADFVDGDGDPADHHGHGTHVTDLVAGAGVPVMVVRALDARAGGRDADVARAIVYAVRHGATIINLSLNTDVDDGALRRAIELARVRGVTIVAAAGNDGRDLDRRPSYPVCSRSPNVVGVGALDLRGRRARFSAHGSCVDRWAPGVDIAGAAPGGGVQVLSGTSQAAAHVTAQLARRP
jgi:subtilisin family serine protease